MRPVTGLERPGVQWTLVAACVVVVGLLAGTMVMIFRERAQIERLLAAQRTAHSELMSLERELARERAAREAFSLELARVRAREAPAGSAADAGVPTLTLVQSNGPRTAPPEATVAAPEPAQTILLRLMLPAGVVVAEDDLLVTARDWSTGRSLWATGAARAATVDGRRAVVTHVSGEMLGPGAYEITLKSGTDAPEPVAVYYLGVRE